MITIALLFFGAVFIYTGILVFDSDSTSAITSGIIGILLVAKPAMEGIRYFRANFYRPPQMGKPMKNPRKTHLKVVEPRDKKPTIH